MNNVLDLIIDKVIRMIYFVAIIESLTLKYCCKFSQVLPKLNSTIDRQHKYVCT